ncbi:unnamed protein product [Closterium sp. NIES-53]
MASLRVLAFDHEGRPIQFDTWLDDLQLYLLSDSRDSVSLFDHTSGAAPALPATADSATRSQWLTRDALYDAVVARYSSPATAALGRLLLPYLFPELSAFATIEDLVSHLRTSNARYRAAASAEDHFLSLDPTVLTIDLLEQHLLAAETSVVAVGAARCTPRTPFFEGCSRSPLAPSYASAAADDVPGAKDVGAASASARRRSSKGKGGRGGGGGSGGGGGGSSGGGGGSGGGGSGGSGGGSGGFGGGGGGSGGSGGRDSGGSGGYRTGAHREGSGGGQRQQHGSCQYFIHMGDRAGQTCRKPHTQHRCFSRLDVAWRAEFGDKVERPCWAELLRSGVAIFDLDYDAILFAMYALCVSAEGDCYLCVPPDPDIEAAALGASESSLPGTAPEVPHAVSFVTAPPSLLSLHLSRSDWLTPLGAQSLPVPPLFSRVRQFRPAHCQVFTSPRSLQTWSGSTPLLVSPPVAPDSPLAPPPWSPLPAMPAWHALPPPCLWSSQISASPPALACPALPSLRRGAAVCRSSLLLVSPDDCSPADSPHGRDLPVLRLHSDRGGEFSSDLLWEFCRGEGILQSFTLPASPQQNGIAERCIGLVMEVARTSMIHAAAPHFLWPFAVRYAAHQLNLLPRVSLPETSPTLRWTGKVGDASVFRFWGSRAFFYHPTSRCVFPSQDVRFDELVPFYCLFPYRSAAPPPPLLILAPGPPPVDPLPPQGPAPSGVSQVDPLPGTVPVEVAGDSSAARGATSGGVASGGAEPGGAESEGAGSGGAEPGGAEPGGAELGGVETAGVEPGGAEPEGVEPGGAESEGAEYGGARPRGSASAGGPAGASPRLSPRPEPLSPQQLREWFAQRTRLWSGAVEAGDPAARDTGAGGARVTARAGGTGGAAAAGSGGARTRGTGAAGTGGVGGVGAGDPTEPGAAEFGGAGARGPGAGGAGAGGNGAGGTRAGGAGAVDPGARGARAGGASGTGAGGTVRPRPYFVPLHQQTSGLTDRHEPASRPASPVRAGRRVPRQRPPPVSGTHAMALRPSFVPLRIPLPAPPESSLHAVPDPESNRAHAASPTLSRLLATISVSPPSVGGECALGTDVLEDRQEDFEYLAAAVPRLASMLLAPGGDPDAPDIPTLRSYAEAITGPYSSQWQTAMDAEMASRKSTGTYVDAVPPSRANIVDGMWIFRVKRPPGSLPAFKARYVARGFRQQQGGDYYQNNTAFLQGSLHEEIWLRRPPGFTGSFPAGTQWSLRRPVYGLRQAPREWHDILRTTLADLGFSPSTDDPSLFLRTDTSLPPFYVLVYVDDLVFATTDTEALTLVKSELQKRHTCTDLGPSALRLHVILATAHSSVYQPLALSSTFGRVQQVDPHGSILWMGPPKLPLSSLPIARLERALPFCLPRACGARQFFFPPRAQAARRFSARRAALCPSCAPWRASVLCPSRAPGRTAVSSPRGLVRGPLVARRGANGGPRGPNSRRLSRRPWGGGRAGPRVGPFRLRCGPARPCRPVPALPCPALPCCRPCYGPTLC